MSDISSLSDASSTFYDEENAFLFLEKQDHKEPESKQASKRARPGQFKTRQELYRAIWNGEVLATKSGLTKGDLMFNKKTNKVVSRKKHEAGLKAVKNLRKHAKKTECSSKKKLEEDKKSHRSRVQVTKDKYTSQMGSREDHDNNYLKFQSVFFKKFSKDFPDHASKKEAARNTWYAIDGKEAPLKKETKPKPKKGKQKLKKQPSSNSQAVVPTKDSYYNNFDVFKLAFEKFHGNKYPESFSLAKATVTAWEQLE